MMILSLILLTNCSQRVPCPETVYPKLQAIDKIPPVYITVNDGTISSGDTKKAFNTIKALRVSENYYWSLIGDYKKGFNK